MPTLTTRRERLALAALVLAAATAGAQQGGQPTMSDPRLERTVADYCAAWSTPDAAARLALLERAFAPTGTYTDPSVALEGRDALSAHIGRTLAGGLPPGARFVVASRVDAHHGALRFAWRLERPDGTLVLEGTDFGEVDADGRIRRIVGFFGAPRAPGGG